MNVLVIGNGFDLDLGLKTKYSDFAQSSIWESRYCNYDKDMDNLASYLYELAVEKTRWFDIEDGITRYVQEKESKYDYSKVEEDRYFFDCLVGDFSAYLYGLIFDNINKESLAFRMSKVIKENNYFDSIYSFNFLLYNNDMINVMFGKSPIFIHNNLYDLVIGIAEDGCKSREYSFLKKANHLPPLQSTNILFDLEKADEVVIFGHSVNAIDKIYFEDCFRKASENVDRKPKKRITIITYDNNSILEISNNIADMGVSLTRLRSNCMLEFIATKGAYDSDNKEKIASLMERLENGQSKKEN